MLQEQNKLLGIEIDESLDSEASQEEQEEEEVDEVTEDKVKNSVPSTSTSSSYLKESKQLIPPNIAAEVPGNKRKQLAGLVKIVKKQATTKSTNDNKCPTSKSLVISSLCQYTDSDSD